MKVPTYGLSHNNFTEDYMFVIKVSCWCYRDEELGSICTRTCIGLTEISALINLENSQRKRITMDSKKGFVCFTGKASSSNFSPYIDSPPVPVRQVD